MVNLGSRRRDIARKVQAQKVQEYHDAMVGLWRNGVPTRFLGYNLKHHLFDENWNGHLPRSSNRKVRNYINNPTRVLLLTGESGTGKSTFAATLAEHLIDNNVNGIKHGVYASTPSLLNRFSFPQDTDPLAECCYADILVLDDVGATTEGITPHQKKSLWSVIDYRWSNEKPTIMTTNMALTTNDDGIGLNDWFGVSAWDRIQDDMVLLNFTGESMRN